jgi:short-subunit dehydrogenase
MQKKLAGHRAVITGASSGIGKEFARQLAALGSDLVIVARRRDRLNELASELEAKYQIKVACIDLDLCSPNSARLLQEKAISEGGPITILINNAGVGRYGAFMDFPLEDHLATLQVNSTVPTELTYHFVKHMLSHGKKSYISQIASISAFQPVGNFTVYSGTKGYLRYFSETLAFELRKTNVSVTCICPGGTYTEFFHHSGQKITSSGHRTMMSAESVVRSSIQAMLKGKSVFVPGFLNKLACFAPRLLPRDFALSMAYFTMRQAVEQISPGAEKKSLAKL